MTGFNYIKTSDHYDFFLDLSRDITLIKKSTTRPSPFECQLQSNQHKHQTRCHNTDDRLPPRRLHGNASKKAIAIILRPLGADLSCIAHTMPPHRHAASKTRSKLCPAHQKENMRFSPFSFDLGTQNLRQLSGSPRPLATTIRSLLVTQAWCMLVGRVFCWGDEASSEKLCSW